MSQATPFVPAARTPSTQRWPGTSRGLGGNIWAAWEDPLGLFTTGLREHGDYVGFRFGWLHYHLVNDPRGAHHVLVENAKNYVKSRNYAGLKLMLGDGLLTSEGDYWKRQRRLAQPAFHRTRLSSFAATMASCTADLIDRWERELLPGHPRFDLHAELMRLTFRIVGRTLLSTELDGVSREFGDALNTALTWTNDYVESVVKVPPWVPTPANLKFRRAQRVIDGLVLRILAERRAEPASVRHDDLLGMLMEVRDETTGEAMTDRQLKDELVTLVLAGHETTANALSFAFHLLSLHPDVARRVRAEATSVLGERLPELADLPNLPYAKAVIEETMRLYPPAWVVERDALGVDEIGGLPVPAGATVAVSPFVMHRHPALWANPEGFDPERFLQPDPNRPKLAYMPFGAGPRTCIGNAFAMMEMQLVLPMIARRFHLDLEPNARVTLDPSVTLRPKHGVPMRLRAI